ncbi:hypothetical protein GCM10022236_11070 [Microlunatus ginsengisoli]|uniref:Uncharacterized protein n=1 Tax=Microlunatus ginsengisoli TaxID=363863 RepID=A0ABP6ZJY0_9ACTN
MNGHQPPRQRLKPIAAAAISAAAVTEARATDKAFGLRTRVTLVRTVSPPQHLAPNSRLRAPARAAAPRSPGVRHCQPSLAKISSRTRAASA